MPSQITITVAPPKNSATNIKGEILENFAKSFLETQNYEVIKRLRLVGSEVDLLAKEISTSEEIIVECKALSAPTPAEVIHKLFGVAHMSGKYSAGWLITTSELTKDAKGIKHARSQLAGDERRKLVIYEPNELADRLIRAKFLYDPNKISKSENTNPSFDPSITLVITNQGEFFAFPKYAPQGRVVAGIVWFNAKSGDAVTDPTTVEHLRSSDTGFEEYEWLQPNDQPDYTTSISNEIQNIVEISSGDSWSDYRPARPRDYVGRNSLRSSIFDFLSNVQKEKTSTRIFALKSPSGWGKSSTIVKIIETAKESSAGKSFFIYAVDCRSASSGRFGEFALLQAFRTAQKQKFINPRIELSLGQPNDLFSTSPQKLLLSELQSNDKTICIVFDQFEELLNKKELSSVFENIQALCYQVDQLQSGICIGFSWKTDGTIPIDHAAYFMWHNLADRRKEYELDAFSRAEINLAINRFEKELRKPIIPPVRRFLVDQCQGYPWLLKKLCVHIFELIKSGLSQYDIQDRSFNISALFKKETESLNSTEIKCLKYIAANSPVEYHQVSDRFDAKIVQSLIDKRMIIRSGNRLSVYWDIFRDYVLTGRAPSIPTSYIPQRNIHRITQAIAFLLRQKNRRTTYDALASHLKLSESGTDNLVRDLIMTGHFEANRSKGTLRAIQATETDAVKQLAEFCVSHKIIFELSKRGFNVPLKEENVQEVIADLYKHEAYRDSTSLMYARRMIDWFVGIGLFEQIPSGFIIREPSSRKLLSHLHYIPVSSRNEAKFLAAAPPEKVLDALQTLAGRSFNKKTAIARVGRNTFFTLGALGFFRDETEDRMICIISRRQATPATLASAAQQMPTTKFLSTTFENSNEIDVVEIATALMTRFGFTWVEASKMRYGYAFRRWLEWIKQVQSN